MAWQPSPLPLAPLSHMGSGLCSSCSTSDAAPWKRPEEAMLWLLPLIGETWMMLLLFGLVHSWPCSHLGNEPADRISISLPLPFPLSLSTKLKDLLKISKFLTNNYQKKKYERQENTNQNHNEMPPHPIRMAVIQRGVAHPKDMKYIIALSCLSQ